MRWTWLADRFVPVLDAVAEGAWIAVLDAAVETVYGHHGVGWGPLPFVLAAGAGLTWMQRLHAPRVAFLGLAILTVGGGLLAGALAVGLPGDLGGPASSARFGLDWIVSLGGEPVGWLIALAVVRGSRHQLRTEDDEVISFLLAWGLPALALPWILGSNAVEPARSMFVAVALPATVLFAIGGLLALGIARLESLRLASGVDWRGNRSWLILLGSVVVAVAVVAVPAGFLLGDPIELLTLGLFGPIKALLSPVGDVLGQLFVILFFWLDPLVNFLKTLFHPQVQQQPIGGTGVLQPPPTPQGPDAGAQALGEILGLIILALIVLGVIAWLSRQTQRRPVAAAGILEEHRINPPTLALHWPSAPRFRRREPVPTTATEAYLAALRQLESNPELARHPSEGAAAHVDRLRKESLEPEALPLLAADFQLEQYGARRLTPAETTRAIGRWRRLRLFAVRQRDRAKRERSDSGSGSGG